MPTVIIHDSFRGFVERGKPCGPHHTRGGEGQGDGETEIREESLGEQPGPRTELEPPGEGWREKTDQGFLSSNTAHDTAD